MVFRYPTDSHFISDQTLQSVVQVEAAVRAVADTTASSVVMVGSSKVGGVEVELEKELTLQVNDNVVLIMVMWRL